MNFGITANLAEFQKAQEQRGKDIFFAGVVALTKTAQQVRTAEVALMRKVLNNPTPFTLNSLQVKPATKDRPSASVETKEGFGSVPAGRFLSPLVDGGQRRMKSHERKLGGYTHPGEFATINRFGNIPGSTYVRILSQVGALGPDQNATKSRRSKAKRKSEAFFRRENVIFLRKGADEAKPFLVITKAPTYTERLPFYREADRVTDKVLPLEFATAFDRYVK